MSKVVRSIGRAVKKVAKGIGKAFKKVVSSKFGKILMVAAAIYLGGAALGMWNSPFASVNGALAGGGTAATPGAAAAGAAPGVGATAAEGVAATTQAVEGAVGAAGAGTTAAGETATQLTAAAQGAGAAAPAAATAPAGTGLINANLAPVVEMGTAAPAADIARYAATAGSAGAAGGAAAGGWLSNPLVQYGLIQGAMGGLQGAFSPDPVEVARKQAQWQMEFLAPNFDLKNLDLGAPSGAVLRDARGNPVYDEQGRPYQPPQAGIINRQLPRG